MKGPSKQRQQGMDQIVKRRETAKAAPPEPIEAALSLDGTGKAQRRRWPWLVALALAAGAGVALWQWNAAAPVETAYRTAEVKPGRARIWRMWPSSQARYSAAAARSTQRFTS